MKLYDDFFICLTQKKKKPGRALDELLSAGRKKDLLREAITRPWTSALSPATSGRMSL